ncbi:hypothetical protein ACJ73_08170 [Blastomyces percursus]|uniref:Uncharacterized protein n=1 Tax=Blastomyces percursus TaxID=1658174 RepID=A0A1J9QWD4_9EURO|nr:hypothetical protein ACJ73_08170 [Blastomyces percursus]
MPQRELEARLRVAGFHDSLRLYCFWDSQVSASCYHQTRLVTHYPSQGGGGTKRDKRPLAPLASCNVRAHVPSILGSTTQIHLLAADISGRETIQSSDQHTEQAPAPIDYTISTVPMSYNTTAHTSRGSFQCLHQPIVANMYREPDFDMSRNDADFRG